MRRLGFGLGLLLLIVAGAAAVAQIFSLLVNASYQPVALGSIWYNIHANSLVGLQALIEKSISPALWPPVLWLLRLPAWLFFGVLGGMLLLLCRGRGRDRAFG